MGSERIHEAQLKPGDESPAPRERSISHSLMFQVSDAQKNSTKFGLFSVSSAEMLTFFSFLSPSLVAHAFVFIVCCKIKLAK